MPRHRRALQTFLLYHLPESVTSHFQCLALEEKRLNEVSMEPIQVGDFLSSYRTKVKDDFLPIEYKVSAILVQRIILTE